MLAYVPLAGGISLVFVATILHPSLGYSLTYPLYGVGIVLLLVSSLLTLRRKRDDKGNPNSQS